MKKEILKYFVELGSLNVDKEDNTILIDGEKVKLTEDNLLNLKYLFDDKYFAYAKSFDHDCPLAMGVSRMFNEVGIATPKTEPLMTPKHNIITHIASQDVVDVGNMLGYEAKPLSQILSLRGILSNLRASKLPSKYYKWQTLTNEEVIENLLKCMTPESLEDYNTKTLLQELVTYADAHLANDIGFVDPATGKISQIIPIDLEYYELLYLLFRSDSYQNHFKNFLSMKYKSNTIFGSYCYDDELSYRQRLNAIKRLILSGKINNKQIKTLKKALNYDLPGSVKALGEKHHQERLFQDSYEMSSRLWDFNRKNLREELGL